MATNSAAEILGTIARVRRAMPRNADVMAVCDIAERAIVKADAAQVERPVVKLVTPIPKPAKKGRAKRATA